MDEPKVFHWGQLRGGQITCTCGWKSKDWVHAADAEEEFAAHLVDEGVKPAERDTIEPSTTEGHSMPRTAYTDSPEGALAALSIMCDEEIVSKLVKGIAAGELEWVADPEHRHVWGVREMGERDPRKVRMVVYTDAGDFELDDEWWLS